MSAARSDALGPGQLGAFSHDEATLLVLDGVLYAVALDTSDLQTKPTTRPITPLGAPVAVAAATDAPVVAWATNDDVIVWAEARRGAPAPPPAAT